jgi:iron-sulfur cluster repair protein YtfE (RIC family)
MPGSTRSMDRRYRGRIRPHDPQRAVPSDTDLYRDEVPQQQGRTAPAGGRARALPSMPTTPEEEAAMTTVTRSLREEHRELVPRIESLRVLADRVGELPTEELLIDLEEGEGFLMTELLPHAVAEERTLYPAVGRLLGSPEATETMSRDHVEITRMADELAALRREIVRRPVHPSQERELRRLLYGLHAVIHLHFRKEEELYLQLIEERLSSKEAEELFEAMELTQDVRGKGRMPPAL